ncbi:MAG: hypothetical protein SGARI_004739 [Bacillariaceae sp.]
MKSDVIVTQGSMGALQFRRYEMDRKKPEIDRNEPVEPITNEITVVITPKNVKDTFGSRGAATLSTAALNFPIAFASFVAGKKTEGPGARTAQPTGNDIDGILGCDFKSAAKSLKTLMKGFNE